MVNQLKQRKQAGFTIIEVMIVLAIAAMILLVVLLAVPALQRSSRNNALQTSVSNILGAVADFQSNNGGILPSTPSSATAPAADGTITISSTTAGAQPEKAKTSTGSVATLTIAANPTINKTTVGTVWIVTGSRATCNATSNGLAGTTTASNRSVVAVYVAESGNGNINRCVSS